MGTTGEPSFQAVDTPGEVFVNLSSGKPLKESEASDLLRAYRVPVVVLAGLAKSGKTTLLASLHDSFQRGPFAGYLSAGSQTLIGFEERCFDSRAASGAESPSTQRTRPAEGQLFYHMKLRNEDLKTGIKQLLLADMSGEFYEGALDSGAEARGLTIIRRADHLVHLVDAGMLVSKGTGSLTQSNAMMFMRRCFEEQMLESDAKVDILLTKWDLALLRGGQEKAVGVLTGINFLALASGNYTFICVQRSSIFSSIGIIGSELPIPKSCKPVLAASGTGFFRHRALRCLSWDRFLGCLATTGSSILWGS